MKKKNIPVTSALCCMALFLLFSCSKSGNGYSNNTGGGTTATGDIVMKNMAFSPATKSVVIGTVVKWVNNDAAAHTVTSNDGTTFSSPTISGGGSFSYTTTVAGTFNYHCTIHGVMMSGTLTVTP